MLEPPPFSESRTALVSRPLTTLGMSVGASYRDLKRWRWPSMCCRGVERLGLFSCSPTDYVALTPCMASAIC